MIDLRPISPSFYRKKEVVIGIAAGIVVVYVITGLKERVPNIKFGTLFSCPEPESNQ